MFFRSFLARGVIPFRRVTVASADDVLRFTFDRTLAGIVFHLMDERLARGVNPESLKDTLARLASDRASGAVTRSVWQSMTNHERLRWLLDCAGVTVLTDPTGVASFRPLRLGDPYLLPRTSVRTSELLGSPPETRC